MAAAGPAPGAPRRDGDPREMELRFMIDDEEEEAKKVEKQKEAAESIDWDKVCAYRTWKVVRIRDKALGCTYWFIVLSVVLYVVVFGFSIGGKHQQQEPGIGTVLTQIRGKVYSGDKVFDPSDLRFPVIEPSGAFLLTRRTAITQKRGVCLERDHPVMCPCKEGEECGKNGEKECEAHTWCPSLGDMNVDNPPDGTLVDELQGLDNVVLKIMSGISFPGLGNRFFVTGNSPGKRNQFKNITVRELLSLAEPPQKLDEQTLKHGALIGVSFFWNCDVSGDCEPAVVIKRLDSGQGFVQKRQRFYRKGGVEYREALYLNGLRILVDSSGMGRKFSLVLAVIQIGSAIALIRVAAIVADFIMLYLFSDDRTKAYYACKVQETDDYSDLQDRINLIKQTKGRPQTKGTSGAGAHVSLGLGAGGRAGLPTAILRGRAV